MASRIRANRLYQAVEAGMKKLESYRRHRGMFIREYTGRYYGSTQGSNKARSQPVNLINQAVNVYLSHIAIRHPKILVRPKTSSLRLQAELTQQVLQRLVEEIDLVKTLRYALLDSMFGVGILRTGLEPSFVDPEEVSRDADPGRPYVENVSVDDFVIDPAARHIEEAAFIGHQYRVPKETLLQSGLFDPEDVERLVSWKERDNKAVYRADRDARAAPQSYDVGEDLMEWVSLIDVWLPTEGLIVTLPGGRPVSALKPLEDQEYVQKGSDKFLRETEYYGPEGGPYDLLGYQWAPDQALPVAPVGIWYDLHRSANVLHKKLEEQAARQKVLVAYEPGAEVDMERIVNAPDGWTVRVADVDRIKEVKFGAAPAENYKHVMFCYDLFNQLAGNVNQLGGIESESNTAYQAAVLQGNSQVRIDDMEFFFYRMADSVVEKLAFYALTDPFFDQTVIKRVNGVDLPIRMTPDVMEADFFDFSFKVEMHSMRRVNTEERAKKLMDWAANIVMPAINLSAATNGAFNADALIKMTARYLDLEEVEELWSADLNSVISLAMAQAQQQVKAQPALGPQTAVGREGLEASRNGTVAPGQSPVSSFEPNRPGGAGQRGGFETGSGVR